MQIGVSYGFQQRQSLVVTARLQQAITLLQMNNSELQSFIEAQAEENPYVETAPPAPLPAMAGPRPSARHQGDGGDRDRIAALVDDRGPSLYAHATAEIARLDLNARDSRIADAFLDALEPSGWLGQPVEAIAASAAATPEAALAVLARLHRIEPAGLFARDLAECLRLQAAAQGILSDLFAAVLDNLPIVAAADLPALARACKCAPADLHPVLRALRSLDPKPGAGFDATEMPVTPPDLIVRRQGGDWQVELNRSTLPGVVIRDETDETAAPRPQPEETARYIAERLSVARWLARAVAHRNATSLRIAAEILRRQKGFLRHGLSQLRPMTLREVADAIGMHESTVSRVCAGLMMQTPQGTLPLRKFFTAALAGRGGEATGSAGAVRHRIVQLIRAESPDRPLSDDALVRIMAGEGVQLAVAPWRNTATCCTSRPRPRGGGRRS